MRIWNWWYFMSSDLSNIYRPFPIFRPNPSLEKLDKKYKEREREVILDRKSSQQNLLWVMAVLLIMLSIPFTLNQIEKTQTIRTKASLKGAQVASIEAEKGEKTKDIFIGESKTSSEGKYIQFGPKGALVDLSSCSILPEYTGKITFQLDIPIGGKYYFWTRLMASNTVNNSFYLKVDNFCPTVVGDIPLPSQTWKWVDYQNGKLDSPIILDLSAGKHTITMVGREANVKIDKIILTSDQNCAPILTGVNCQEEEGK